MLKKVVAYYALLIGISMVLTWVAYFFTGSIFGVVPPAPGIGFHIAAELATAFMLIAAGAAFLMEKPAAKYLYGAAMGMLLYAVLNSPGLYVGNPGYKFMLMIFSSSFVMAAVFFILGFFVVR